MYQSQVDCRDCLGKHAITPALRARMTDWMIEVLTNFKCDDQTYFLAVNLQDRFLKNTPLKKEVNDLHIIGVTCMFVASKYEDIFPLKMKTIYEKIAHQKLEIQAIKSIELDLLKTIDYKIHTPTVLDFLKVYLQEVLGITVECKTLTKKKEEAALKQANKGKNETETNANVEMEEQKADAEFNKLLDDPFTSQNYLIEKMCIYLAKMSMHSVELASRMPSLIAVGSIYVALKICEQLTHKELINVNVVTKLIQVSQMQEDDILDASQKVLYLAQNFDREFPGLENLKKTHFGIITQLL